MVVSRLVPLKLLVLSAAGLSTDVGFRRQGSGQQARDRQRCEEYRRHGIQAPNTHLVSFYTEGRPYANLTKAHRAFMRLYSPHFTTMRVWSDADLRRETRGAYMHEVELPTSTGVRPDVRLRGFKPWILLEALRRADTGDIVVWRDITMIKSHSHVGTIAHMPSLARFVLDSMGADVFMPSADPSKFTCATHVATKVVRELGAGFFVSKFPALRRLNQTAPAPATPEEAASLFEAVQACAPGASRLLMAKILAFPLLAAHTIFVRRSDRAVAMIREWLNAVRHAEWVVNRNDFAPHPTYRAHRAEPGIFAVLAARWVVEERLPRDFPKYSFGHQERTVQCGSLRAWRPGWLNTTTRNASKAVEVSMRPKPSLFARLSQMLHIGLQPPSHLRRRLDHD